MQTVHKDEEFLALVGGSAPSKVPPLHDPTLDAILLPNMRGLGVGLRLMKASVKKVFLWDRLYMARGCSTAFFPSPSEVMGVFSDAKGPGAEVRLVRRDA